jgi:hypothetical protein
VAAGSERINRDGTCKGFLSLAAQRGGGIRSVADAASLACNQLLGKALLQSLQAEGLSPDVLLLPSLR